MDLEALASSERHCTKQMKDRPWPVFHFARSRWTGCSALFRKNHRLVVLVLVRIRDFVCIDAALFFPSQECNHTQDLFLAHGRAECAHRTPEIFRNPRGNSDVNTAVGIARIFEY